MIATGIPLSTSVDPSVLIAWMQLLKAKHWPGPLYDARGVYPVQARNKITSDFLNGPADALFMFDSDQLPPLLCSEAGQPKHLLEVLESITEPVVCGLVYMRQPPYEPVAYTLDKDGNRHFLTPERMAEAVGKRGMVEIDCYGSGSLLIQRRVLEDLLSDKTLARRREIWESTAKYDWDEGWQFSAEVRGLGYKLWLHTGIEAAHLETRPIFSNHYFTEHGYEATSG